jgi:hypothetical protein
MIKFNDAVVRGRDVNGKRTVIFPTLSVCPGCHGLSGFYHGGKLIHDPQLAFHIALVKFGRLTIHVCDNLPPSHACDCALRIEELQRAMDEMPITGDSNWVYQAGTSVPKRGIIDYKRTMTCSRILSHEEVGIIVEFLSRANCPGCTGVVGHSEHEMDNKEKNVYEFTTTWDSSD